MFQGIIGMRWNTFRAFIIKQKAMSNASMISTTSRQDLLTIRTKHFANKGMDYKQFAINLLVSAVLYHLKIQFIIIALKSVCGIEQLVNGLSYALDVLGILLSFNRCVKKSIQEKNIFIALVILLTKILLMTKKNLC
jgi:hypothetical protein